MRYILLIFVVFCTNICMANTGKIDVVYFKGINPCPSDNFLSTPRSNSVNTIATTNEWNFISDAKNLTAEEKKYFNDLANCARNGSLGSWNIEALSARVKMLDNGRESERVLKNIKSDTNIVWIGSVVTTYWQKTGSNSYETIGNFMQSFSSNPLFVIGLRKDGTVVWRKFEE